MIDPSDAEKEALALAGERGGEYLDALQKTDLATMDEQEWRTFVACVCGGYVEGLHSVAKAMRQLAGEFEAKVTEYRSAPAAELLAPSAKTKVRLTDSELPF